MSDFEMLDVSPSDEISGSIPFQASTPPVYSYATEDWITFEPKIKTARSNSSLAVANGFLAAYDSNVRFLLESILAASSMIVNGSILVSTCNYSRNRKRFHLGRPSLYSLLFLHLTLVNFLSAPITWVANNILLAGRKCPWFQTFVKRLTFCQFIGVMAGCGAVSMVINLAATFLIFGFSLVQCVAVTCPLRQLSLLRRRNIRYFLIVCWLGVLVGWIVPTGIIVNILQTVPPESRAFRVARNLSASNSTIGKPRRPLLCYKSQVESIALFLSHFSYLATFLIAVMYVSAFGFCVATFLKIRKVGKEMTDMRNRSGVDSKGRKGRVESETFKSDGKPGSKQSKATSSSLEGFRRSTQDKRSVLISRRDGQETMDTKATSGRPGGIVHVFEIQEGCETPHVINSGSDNPGPTNSDKRAFMTITALVVVLAFYLLPTLIIQILTIGPLQDVISSNAFVIYLMALLPHTKYLLDPVIYGMRMPEMKSAICCICCRKLITCFDLPRRAIKSFVDSKPKPGVPSAGQTKSNLKRNESNNEVGVGGTVPLRTCRSAPVERSEPRDLVVMKENHGKGEGEGVTKLVLLEVPQ